MRQRGRERLGFFSARLAVLCVACVTGGVARGQSPATASASGTATPPAAVTNPWATGGVAGTAVNSGTVPYWQAAALPAAVIQGGAIPPGWTPQAVPYQGVGPDGRPVTMFYAPTYVFTYQIGPPVIAAAVAPGASRVNRRQAMNAAPTPATMQGWNYQTQGAPPAAYTLPPATVARYQPVPYQYPPGSRQLGGTPIVPPASAQPASTPPVSAPAALAVPPPPAAPTQWTPSGEPLPAGLLPESAPPMSPLQSPAPQAAAAVAAPLAAGTAAALAGSPPPQPIATQATGQSVPAQPVSLAPQQPSGRVGSQHLWRVVGVHDGDTLTCLDESNQQQKVRLAEIDAPEIGQDYGKVSREVLAEMVFGKTVDVTEEGKDRYGRWIGHLSLGGVDVNRQMVASGNAWHYVDYSRDTSLSALEAQARSQRLGLWAQPNPVAPWDFRNNAQK